MSRKGYTNKECPGCRGTNERRVDSICPKCLELIETGRRYRERYKALAESNKDIVNALVPDNWCKPYYKTIHGNDQKAEELAETIVKIAKMTSLPAPVVTSYEYRRHLENKLTFDADYRCGKHEELFGKRFEWNEPRIFEKVIFDLLNKLDAQIKTVTKEAYSAGLDTGKKSLIMLNAGKITLSEFDDDTIKR